MILDPIKKQKKELLFNLNTKKSKDKKDDKFFKGFENGISESFKMFDVAINSYDRYKNEVKLLMKEQQSVWKKWINYYNKKSGINNNNYLENYNNWLYNYIFIEKEEENFDTLL
jgi:hypothetical protein